MTGPDAGSTAERRGRGPGRAPRSDAVRNRDRIVESAYAVFTEQGASAGVRDVAAHAGVGLGTLYRHFPDKDALLLAVVEQRFAVLAERTRAASEELEPWPAFVAVMELMARMMTEDRALAGAIGRARHPAVRAPGDSTGPQQAMDAALSELARRARDAGELRSDIGPGDLALVIGGVAMALDQAGPVAAADEPPWRRFLDVALDGLRESSRGAARR